MDLERKADNHPDAEPPRGSERRASLKRERGSVEKVPRNRKRQSRSALSLLRGTDGSNPFPSSREFVANLFKRGTSLGTSASLRLAPGSERVL